MKTTAELIASFEAKRAAHVARQAAIMEKSNEEGRTLDPAEAEEHDTLTSEIKAIDDHLVRLKNQEAAAVATATLVTQRTVATPEAGAQTRSAAGAGGGNVVAWGRSVLPKGTAFTRYAMALAASKGNRQDALEIAEKWKDSTPEVAISIRGHAEDLVLKSAQTGGSTTVADWGETLIAYTTMTSEFIELLRPATIMGKMPGMRRVPFNIRVAGQTQASTVGWVGQTKPKPVSEMKFNEVILGFAKAAGIVVVSQELAKFSSPAALDLVQRDMIATMAQFLDEQFINPAVSAVANVSPGSITNGVSHANSTGFTIATVTTDVGTIFGYFIAANLAPSDAVWIMRPETALALSQLRTLQDLYAFPDINMGGGTWFGLPVITSRSVPSSTSGGTIIVLADQDEIFVADDGAVRLDVSEQASLQMDSAPSDGAQSLVSLWQTNQVGIRAERYINWMRRRDTGVAYLDNVHYQ